MDEKKAMSDKMKIKIFWGIFSGGIIIYISILVGAMHIPI